MKDNKMKTPTRILSTIAILACTFLYSCQKSQKNELADAQLCLNTATSSTAMSCVSGLSENIEPLAYSLRCTAIFVSQGFGDAASFVNALDSINSTGNCAGGCSSTINAMYALTFTSAGVSNPTELAANNAAAADAFAQCSLADAKIYTQIASIFRLGTLTSMLAYGVSGGAPITEDSLKAAVASGALDAATVGAIVSVTYENTCQNTTNASDSTVQFCAELSTAISAGTTEAQIGACLIAKLENPSYTGPLCP